MEDKNTVYSTLNKDTIRDLKMFTNIDLINSITIEKQAKQSSKLVNGANESVTSSNNESTPGNRLKKRQIICVSDYTARAATVHKKTMDRYRE
jgi:hypothetical protein